MSDRWKKILFAVGFVIVSAGMGYVVYTILFRPPGQQIVEQPTPTPTGQLPEAGPGGAPTVVTPGGIGELPPSGGVTPTPTEIEQLATTRTHTLREGVTQSVTASPDGSGARFYNPEDGRFYRVSSDGTIRSLGDKQFFNVSDVSWANTKDEVVLEFPDGRKVFYDFEDKQQVNLPNHWEDFAFAPTDDRMAAKSIGLDPDNRFLIVTNPDGTEAKAIEPLGDNADKMIVDWSPTGQIVGYSFTGDPQSGNNQQILFVGQNHENFKSIIAPGQGFVPNWSPSGKQILYSVWAPENGNKPSLWVSSGDTATMGANRKSLNLSTWADKCVWANETELFCAVPQDLPDNAGLLRSQFATLSDDVYHIDLAVGSAIKINTPDQNYPVRQPVVNKDMSKFIFTDAATGRLYSYDIK